MAYTAKEIWESLSPEEQEEYLNYEYPPDEERYILFPKYANREKDIREFYEGIKKNKFDIDGFLSSIYCFFATVKKDFKRAARYYMMISKYKRIEADLLCFGDIVDFFPLTDEEMEELNREIEAAKKHL